MRRTLTVLVTAAALLVPATAASAGQVDRVKSNASCSNGKGGNGAEWNGAGNVTRALASGLCGELPPAPPPPPADPTKGV